jgi:hypothetical protein
MKIFLRNLYYFLLIALPYFSILAKISHLPFGLFANLILVIIVVITLLKGLNVKDWLLFLVLSFFLLAIIICKKVVFDINLGEMIGSRYYLIIFLYYYVTIWLIVNGDLKLDFVYKVIVINSLFMALYGIAHFLLFPSFNIYLLFLQGVDLENFIKIGGLFRETGFMFNANVYANFLLLGLFLVINKMDVKNDQNIIMYVYCFILLFGIFLSQSRFATAFSILVFGLYCFKLNSLKKLILVIIMIPLTTLAVMKLVNKTFDRHYFFEDRAVKNKIALSIMKSDTKYDLIGAPQKVLVATDDDYNTFSDNAYFEIALNCGIPFAVFYYILFISIFFLSANNFKSYFFIFYMLSLLFLTNCIGWNYWILYIFPVYFILIGKDAVISGKSLIKLNKG